TLRFAGVLQDQLALLGVAAFLVALQAADGTDLGPDFLREVIVHDPAARRPVVRLLVLARGAGGGGGHKQAETENQETPWERHLEPLDSRCRQLRPSRTGILRWPQETPILSDATPADSQKSTSTLCSKVKGPPRLILPCVEVPSRIVSGGNGSPSGG